MMAWGHGRTFHERKAERVEHYEKYVKGWKLVKCGACSGSGYYDSSDGRGRTPKCSACEGEGVERISPREYEQLREFEKYLELAEGPRIR
jgi:hypothetical protein